MSIFKKLFGKNESQIDDSKFKVQSKLDFSSLDELIEQNAGLSFEKQLIFGNIIGSKAWGLDMAKGTISFGELSFPIQIIGSLAFNNLSWMWGWANTQSGMPENLLVQSHQLKELGDKKGIKELSERHFSTSQGFEHKIGMLSCGFFNAKSYYCANYGQGTMVVTIDDDQIPAVDKNNVESILTNFPQLISGTELNHKRAFLNYLIDRDFKIAISENIIEGLRNNKVVIGDFDEANRLKSLNGKL